MSLSSTVANRILDENRLLAKESGAQSESDYLRICLHNSIEPIIEDNESVNSESNRFGVECSIPGPVPWYRTFRETVLVSSIASSRKIARAISEANKPPEGVGLVVALGARRLRLFEQQVASRKRALVHEFPFGIAGARASVNKSPEAVKLCSVAACSRCLRLAD